MFTYNLHWRISFIFMQFSAKILQNNRFTALTQEELAHLPLPFRLGNPGSTTDLSLLEIIRRYVYVINELALWSLAVVIEDWRIQGGTRDTESPFGPFIQFHACFVKKVAKIVSV